MSKNDSMLVDPHPDYTVERLDRLMTMALLLGFQDDVRHWRGMRDAKVAYEREVRRRG